MSDPIPDPHPSGRNATLHEAVVIVDQAVAPIAKATRLQWVGLSLLGAFTVGGGGFLAWCLITVGALSNAQAQTKATAERALEVAKTNTTRIESVDAGSRVEIINLRKELSEDRSNTDKKLSDMQLTLNAILRAQKK